LSLLSAATFAFNNACTRRGVLTGTVSQALAITVPIGVPIFFLVALAAGTLGTVAGFSPAAIGWLSLAGVIHFVWGRYCNYRATKAVGANLTGPVQQFDIVVSLALAIWILGESLTPLRLIGILLIVAGSMIALREDIKTDPAAPVATDRAETAAETEMGAARPPPFRPNYPEGILWSLLSTTGYGVSPVLVAMGLSGRGLGESLAGGLISYLAATVVIAAMTFVMPGQLRHVVSVGREAAKWFTISGVFVCVSQVFRYMALAVAPVAVVSPIGRTTIVFRIVFSWMLNREHEVFGSKVILGTVVTLIGALALSVSTEIVLSLYAWPDFVVAIARWQWP
jgi:uncharacterized membrane protein